MVGVSRRYTILHHARQQQDSSPCLLLLKFGPVHTCRLWSGSELVCAGVWLGGERFKANQQSKYNKQSGQMQQRRGRGRYLDVSEYILKEYSPMTKAMNADFRLTERGPLERHATPEIAPIDHDGSTLKITPFLHGLLDFDDEQLDDFLLDGGSAEGRREARREGRRRRRSNSLVLLHFEDELEGIVEESDFADYSLSSSESAGDDAADEQYDGDGSAGESEGGASLSQQQMQTQSQYREKVQRYLRQPRGTLLREMSRLSEGKGQLNQNQKLENIKKTIQSYIVDFQQPSFDDAWNQLNLPLAQKVDVLAQGIDLTFNKRIGSLTFEQRRLKLLRYLEKKRMRKWRKKVSYDCRKKVADSRLRIKGKFVTREQVCSQLGLVDLEQFTGDELKEMLERKLEEGREKSAE